MLQIKQIGAESIAHCTLCQSTPFKKKTNWFGVGAYSSNRHRFLENSSRGFFRGGGARPLDHVSAVNVARLTAVAVVTARADVARAERVQLARGRECMLVVPIIHHGQWRGNGGK